MSFGVVTWCESRLFWPFVFFAFAKFHSDTLYSVLRRTVENVSEVRIGQLRNPVAEKRKTKMNSFRIRLGLCATGRYHSQERNVLSPAPK